MRRAWGRTRKSEPAALTGAAAVSEARTSKANPKTLSWQEQGWKYYDELGEFRFAVEWKSEMVSRVRLRAARVRPNQDEPEIVDDGIAADLVDQLSGGLGTEAGLLGTIETHLSVPGESWLIGEDRPDGRHWVVRSTSEFRLKTRPTPGRPAVYEVIDETASGDGEPRWRALEPSSMIIRIWRPHKRQHHIADSPVRAMRSTMLELDLANRRIQAHYMSRLSTSGVFIMPREVEFPVREEFQDEPDPFAAEWIATAKQAIAEPGAASAVVPIPMSVPQEYVESFRFIDFSTSDEADLIAKRESAIRKLATEIDVPAEILLGMADTNHWTSWQIEESAIKTHISSDVELIVEALTVGYLRPMLEASGEDPDGWVVWYDLSELAMRPDKSGNAQSARTAYAIGDPAFRRELGLDEADAPDDQELRRMLLIDIAKGNPQLAPWALQELGFMSPSDAPAVAPAEPAPPDAPPDAPPADQGPPDTKDSPPPPPGPDVKQAARAARVHRLTVDRDGWTLHHPDDTCRDALFTCPVAEASRFLSVFPGTPGDYECWLGGSGDLIVGGRTFASWDGWVAGHHRERLRTKRRRTNGVRVRA